MTAPSVQMFRGCLLGQCLGDALGFPVEGHAEDDCNSFIFRQVKYWFDNIIPISSLYIDNLNRIFNVHEMKVAQEIISFSEKEMHERGFATLTEIGIKVGALSCIDPESLSFAFDVLKKETGLSQAVLNIERVTIEARCLLCGTEFKVADYVFVCPKCGASDVEVHKGEELVITYLTGER